MSNNKGSSVYQRKQVWVGALHGEVDSVLLTNVLLPVEETIRATLTCLVRYR